MNCKMLSFRFMLLILTVGAGINHSFARSTGEWDAVATVPLGADTVRHHEKAQPDSVQNKANIKKIFNKRRKGQDAALQQPAAAEKLKAIEPLWEKGYKTEGLPDKPKLQDVPTRVGASQNARDLKGGGRTAALGQLGTGQSASLEAVITQPDLPVPLKNIGERIASIDENSDQDQLKKMAVEQAGKHLALDKLAENLPQVKAAQQKFSGYKNRLSWLRESSGKPSNSLGEEPLAERFIWGLNLQPKLSEPFTMGMAPYLGYRLNKKITTGASFVASGELTEKHSPKEKALTLSAGYRLYADYKLIRGFFAHAEFENLYARAVSQPDSTMVWQWQRKGYAGIGRSIALNSKINLNMYFLADLTHQGLSKFNKEAFQVRIGFGKGN